MAFLMREISMPKLRRSLLCAVAAIFLLMCFAVCAVAQVADETNAVRREHWAASVVAGGGTGLTDRTNVQFIRAGVRLGRVMTGVIGHGALRGTLEEDVEIYPVDEVLWGGYHNVYGFAVNPVVLKWNFTAGHKLAPYFVAQGGMLHTSEDVPPPNTSKINFTSGAGFGFNYFVAPRRSIAWDVRAIHLSNASLGDHNPGVNASLQFSLAYTWWKR